MRKTFREKIYEVAAKIPRGKVATYKQIATLAGSPKAYRAVGTAMAQNPDMTIVPCHRVVGSDGSMHGYSSGDGVKTKIEKLKAEGVKFVGKNVQLETSQWEL